MRFSVLLFIVLIGAIAYLTFLNQGYLTLHLTKEYSFESPIVALILFSMAFGGLLVATGVGVRGIKGLFRQWKTSSRQKRETKTQEAYSVALNALLAKRYDEATRLLERLLEIDPTHVQGLWRLGNLRRQEKNYGEAIRLHRKARSLNEQDREVLIALIKDLEEAQRLEEAIGVLGDLLKADERNLMALAWTRDLYIRLNKWEEAHQIQEKILKVPLPAEDLEREQSVYVGIKYEVGRLHLDKGMLDQARKYLKGTIKLDRRFLPGYVGLGEASIQEGHLDHAAELWEKAYRQTANLVLLHRLEDLFVEIGEPERILRIYREAVAENPSDRVLRFYLGKLYYRLEMLEDAFEQLSGIDLGDDRFPDFHKLMGSLYLRQGDPQAAAEEFKKALNFRKQVVVPYHCSTCDYQTKKWTGRCPQCGQWDRLEATPAMAGPLQSGPPLKVSP